MSALTQKKVRHIKRIILRNLSVQGLCDKGCTDCYFTLSVDEGSKPFYTSDICYDTLNPSWAELPEWSETHPAISIKNEIYFRLFSCSSELPSRGGIIAEAKANGTGVVLRPAAMGSIEDLPSTELLTEHLMLDTLEAPFHTLSLSTLPNMPVNSLLLLLPDGIYSTLRVSREMGKLKTDHKAFLDQGTSKTATPGGILDGFYRILLKQKETAQVKAETEQVCDEITKRVEALSVRQTKARKIAARAKRIQDLQALCDKEEAMLQHERTVVNETRQKALPRCAILISQLKQLVEYREKLHAIKRTMDDNDRPTHRKLLSKVHTRQRRQLFELSSIYTISCRRNERMGKVFLIRDAPLPTSDLKGTGTRDAQDDEKLALALGYICHLVFMLSKIFEIPLRYNIVYKSSRSQIVDEVLGLLPFPLSQQSGQEKRFELGRACLNKNIEQLLNLRYKNWPRPTRSKDTETNMLEHLQLLFNHEIPSLSGKDSGF